MAMTDDEYRNFRIKLDESILHSNNIQIENAAKTIEWLQKRIDVAKKSHLSPEVQELIEYLEKEIMCMESRKRENEIRNKKLLYEIAMRNAKLS